MSDLTQTDMGDLQHGMGHCGRKRPRNIRAAALEQADRGRRRRMIIRLSLWLLAGMLAGFIMWVWVIPRCREWNGYYERMDVVAIILFIFAGPVGLGIAVVPAISMFMKENKWLNDRIGKKTGEGE
jgi:hypothetical protein